jgi:hypothetical protein
LNNLTSALIKNKSIQNSNILLVLTSKLHEYNKYSQNNNKLACFVSEDIDQTIGVLWWKKGEEKKGRIGTRAL